MTKTFFYDHGDWLHFYFFLQFVPKWVAPNVLTLTGFCQLLVNFALLTYYDPHFFAASRDHPEDAPIPNWVWLVCAFNNFMSHTLGKTAVLQLLVNVAEM